MTSSWLAARSLEAYKLMSPCSSMKTGTVNSAMDQCSHTAELGIRPSLSWRVGVGWVLPTDH